MGGLGKLPTLASWAKDPENEGATPKHKLKSRLEEKADKRKCDAKAEEAWKKAVRKRDGMTCRWCRRTVVVTMALIPERAECHHLVPRAHRATRYDPRAACLLCAACHQRVTGGVGGEKAIVIAGRTFTLDGHEYPDGSGPLNFKVL